jgi:TetR/AcrR family transcriptional repressor of nem operon
LSQTNEDIIDTLILILKGKDKNFQNGCPLGNVLQECSGLDEDFVKLMDDILKSWEKLFEDALNKAIEKQEIKNINTKEMSLFLIAIYEGAILMSKRSKSSKEYQICINQLEFFLNSLKIRVKP